MKKEFLLLLSIAMSLQLWGEMTFKNNSQYPIIIELDYPHNRSTSCPDIKIVVSPNTKKTYTIPESYHKNKCVVQQIIFTQDMGKDKTNLCVAIHGHHGSRVFTIDNKGVSITKMNKKISFPFKKDSCAKK